MGSRLGSRLGSRKGDPRFVNPLSEVPFLKFHVFNPLIGNVPYFIILFLLLLLKSLLSRVTTDVQL